MILNDMQKKIVKLIGNALNFFFSNIG